MDFVSDIFETLKLQGLLYFRTDFTGPWGVTVPDLEQAARFHFVLAGKCYVRVGESLIELNTGDLVLIPGGASHALSDSAKHSCPQLEKVLSDANYDGSGVLKLGNSDNVAATRMLCGHYTFRPGASHPVLDALPDCLHINSIQRATHPILDDVLRLQARCMAKNPAGADAAMIRLAEIVFAEAVQAGAEQSPELRNILQAFKDEKVSRALKLMHSDPGRNWSVDSLASQVAMSRSRFADRFSLMMGIGPMAYLADWRLQRGMQQLQSSRLSVQEIALSSGYKSASAFTRAFTDKSGMTPSQYRLSTRTLQNVS